MRKLSNLPPGVTDADIERHATGHLTKRTRAGDLEAKAVKAGWKPVQWWDVEQKRPRAYGRPGTVLLVGWWNSRRWCIIDRYGCSVRMEDTGRRRLFGSWVAAALMADRLEGGAQ